MTLLTLELLGDSTAIAETTHTLDFPLAALTITSTTSAVLVPLPADPHCPKHYRVTILTPTMTTSRDVTLFMIDTHEADSLHGPETYSLMHNMG